MEDCLDKGWLEIACARTTVKYSIFQWYPSLQLHSLTADFTIIASRCVRNIGVFIDRNLYMKKQVSQAVSTCGQHKRSAHAHSTTAILIRSAVLYIKRQSLVLPGAVSSQHSTVGNQQSAVSSQQVVLATS